MVASCCHRNRMMFKLTDLASSMPPLASLEMHSMQLVILSLEDVGDFFVETFGGEKLNEFKLFDIHKEWEYEILAEKEEISNMTTESKLSIVGKIDFEVSLFAKFQITGVVPVFAHVGTMAEYNFEVDLIAYTGAQ